GCAGVPASGRCEGGVARYCDLASGSLRQVDCRALGQSCVSDPDRGAACVDLGLGAPVQGELCDGLVDRRGVCAQGAAIWCDADAGQIVAWDCAGSGLSCGVDQCQSGAYCCERQATPEDECERLGYYGECSG